MKIEFASSRPEEVHALVVLVGKDRAFSAPADAADQATGGQLRRVVAAARFDGDAAQVVEVIAPGGMSASRLLAVGTGAAGKADRALYERIGGVLASRLQTSGETHIVVDVTGAEAAADINPGACIALGALLRNWRYDNYRTKLPEKQKPTLNRLTVVGAPAQTKQIFNRLSAVAEGVFLTRELVTEPANIIYPESFVERCAHADESWASN